LRILPFLFEEWRSGWLSNRKMRACGLCVRNAISQIWSKDGNDWERNAICKYLQSIPAKMGLQITYFQVVYISFQNAIRRARSEKVIFANIQSWGNRKVKLHHSSDLVAHFIVKSNGSSRDVYGGISNSLYSLAKHRWRLDNGFQQKLIFQFHYFILSDTNSVSPIDSKREGVYVYVYVWVWVCNAYSRIFFPTI
jgi:hypothetical protein